MLNPILALQDVDELACLALDLVPLRRPFTPRGPDLGDGEGRSAEAHRQASGGGKDAAPDAPTVKFDRFCPVATGSPS